MEVDIALADAALCYCAAQQEGSPLNLLTSMASWVHQAQTALFQMGPSEGSDGSSLQVRLTALRMSLRLGKAWLQPCTPGPFARHWTASGSFCSLLRTSRRLHAAGCWSGPTRLHVVRWRCGCTPDGEPCWLLSPAQALPTSPFPDPLRPLLNVTGSWGNIIAGSHPDIVPEALIQALTELPFGPQLNNAALALPTFTVRPCI